MGLKEGGDFNDDFAIRQISNIVFEYSLLLRKSCQKSMVTSSDVDFIITSMINKKSDLIFIRIILDEAFEINIKVDDDEWDICRKWMLGRSSSDSDISSGRMIKVGSFVFLVKDRSLQVSDAYEDSEAILSLIYGDESL